MIIRTFHALEHTVQLDPTKGMMPSYELIPLSNSIKLCRNVFINLLNNHIKSHSNLSIFAVDMVIDTFSTSIMDLMA